jgi:predicted transposase/invertase (TIGR01784 family)
MLLKDAAEDYLIDQRKEIEDKARLEGEARSKAELARKMLAKGKSIDEIIELTDLTLEQIEQLKLS